MIARINLFLLAVAVTLFLVLVALHILAHFVE